MFLFKAKFLEDFFFLYHLFEHYYFKEHIHIYLFVCKHFKKQISSLKLNNKISLFRTVIDKRLYSKRKKFTNLFNEFVNC